VGWRKRRQRKWRKDKEKGRWIKKMETGKETHERRYEEERRSKSAEEERSGFKKKKEEEQYWDYVRKFEIGGLVETWVEEWSWQKIEKLLPNGKVKGKTRNEERKSCGRNNNRDEIGD
jgi:hypothetical protein